MGGSGVTSDCEGLELTFGTPTPRWHHTALRRPGIPVGVPSFLLMFALFLEQAGKKASSLG